jgi:nitrite reductase/ring-hydroxylating ferredoxin subunit
MIRRMLARLLTPLLRRLVGTIPLAERWERVAIVPSLAAIASGARNEFSWYFEGESAVAVSSLDEIHAWLASCSYAHDMALFRERDFWQHPVTFERLRTGDCEDFALWAWRKLVELGYDADFVIGYTGDETASAARHAWIVFRRDGAEYVYEPVRKHFDTAVQPLTTVMAHYTPEYGVGRDLVRYTYMGRVSVVLSDSADRSVGTARTATSHLTRVAADNATSRR